MTAPKQQNIKAPRGDSKTWTITFDQDTSTFVEIWFTIRDSWAVDQADDTDAVAQAKLSDGSIVITGTYTADADFTDAQMVLLTSTKYVYDVQIRTATGKIYTTQFGIVSMGPDATRSTAAP